MRRAEAREAGRDSDWIPPWIWNWIPLGFGLDTSLDSDWIPLGFGLDTSWIRDWIPLGFGLDTSWIWDWIPLGFGLHASVFADSILTPLYKETPIRF